MTDTKDSIVEFVGTIFSQENRTAFENGRRRRRAKLYALNLSLRRYLYLHSLLAYIYLETFARQENISSTTGYRAWAFQPLSFENISIRKTSSAEREREREREKLKKIQDGSTQLETSKSFFELEFPPPPDFSDSQLYRTIVKNNLRNFRKKGI